MRKKWFQLLGTIIIAVSLTGCGNILTESSFDSEKEEDDFYTVNMVIIGKEQRDEARIETAMNKILEKEVGARIDIICLPFSTYSQQLQIMMAGNEKLDLVPVMRENAMGYISGGQIRELSGLIDSYGNNIKAVLEKDMVKVSSVGEFVYGVPIEREYFLDTAIMMRKDLVEKYNIDTSNIHSLEDCEDAFRIIQKNEPKMKILLGNKDTGLFGNILYGVDMMLDGYGVLENGGQSTNVVNLYECDQFVNLVKTAHDFYEKGYVDKEILTSTDTISTVMQAGNGFAYLSSWKPSVEAEQTAVMGRDMIAVKIQDCDAFNSSDLVSWLSWGIAENSENPEKAMQVLDCLYNNEELVNLLDWGQKDVDYRVIDEDNGIIAYPEGMDAVTTGYHLSQYWELPMKYDHYIWEAYSREDMDEERKLDKTVMSSNAVGFMYNFSELTDEITALNDIKRAYLPLIVSGVADPEKILPEFNQKLYEAGLQKVMDEKQRQFNEWYTGRSVS